MASFLRPVVLRPLPHWILFLIPPSPPRELTQASEFYVTCTVMTSGHTSSPSRFTVIHTRADTSPCTSVPGDLPGVDPARAVPGSRRPATAWLRPGSRLPGGDGVAVSWESAIWDLGGSDS